MSTRRNMSTGARAMATALVLAADGRRENGRWERGSILGIQDSLNTGEGQWRNLLSQAGVVLDYAPDEAEHVVRHTSRGIVQLSGRVPA